MSAASPAPGPAQRQVTLPGRSFVEIADELAGVAGSAREAVNAAAVLEARGVAGGGLRHTAGELERRAEITGELAAFFRAAAPNEEIVRDLIAGLATLDGGGAR